MVPRLFVFVGGAISALAVTMAIYGAYLFVRATTFLLAGGFDPEMAFGEERKLAEKIPMMRRVVLNRSLCLRPRNP